MSDINSFGIIGGDIRQLYCARSIYEDGLDITVSGFGRSSDMMGMKETPADAVIERVDAIILPLPVSKDGERLNSPFAEEPLPLSEIINSIGKDKPVFAGMYGSADPAMFKGMNISCYSSREEFAAANAVPTAEGAIGTAINEFDGTLNGSRILVMGYGRIGRILSMMLRGMGAEVSVSVRRLKDAEMVRAAGMKPEFTDHPEGSYDIIFNTVPVLVLDARTLARCASDALIIDLASLPGGIDDNAAARMGIRVIHALSMPGKTAPRTAGIIIKNTIYNMINEMYKNNL